MRELAPSHARVGRLIFIKDDREKSCAVHVDSQLRRVIRAGKRSVVEIRYVAAIRAIRAVPAIRADTLQRRRRRP